MRSRQAARLIGVLAGIGGLTASGLAQAQLFSEATTIPTGSWPEAVAIGDVNGDGRNDVVMTTSYYFDEANDYKLFVFAQNADGALAPPVRYATSGTYTDRPESVAIGDVNDDGLNDIVVGNGGASIEIFHQGADGALLPSTVLSTPYGERVRVGDLNNDGRADIAGIGWGGSEAGVFLQDSAGSVALSAAYYAPHGGYDDMALGDVNHDGLTDIVVMSGQSYAYDNLAVLRQSSTGFESATFHDLGGDELTSGVGVGDVTGDGRADVVVSYGGNRPSSMIGIFAQNSDGTLDLPTSMESYDIPSAVAIDDINGDEKADVLVLHDGWNALGVYIQESGGTLASESLVTAPVSSYNPDALATGDINGDGRADVASVNHNSGLVVLLNTSPGNQAPVADAGSDISAYQGDAVTLDGTGSSDTDGTIESFEWTQVAGCPASMAQSIPGVTTVVVPDCDQDQLVFELLVTDNDGATSTDQVAVHILNRAPVSDAGADISMTQGGMATLDGTGSSDPDGTIAAYEWNQVSGYPVTISTTSVPGVVTFVGPDLNQESSTELVFELTVTDDNGATSTDQVHVLVLNQSPVADAGADLTVPDRSVATLDGTGSHDPDGSIVSYAWRQISGIPVSLVVSSTPGVVTFNAPKLTRDKYTELVFELTVTDDDGASSSDQVHVVVLK